MGRQLMRRTFDALVAGLGLILLAFPMLLIGLAVYGTMGRPVIFRQRRGGLKGTTFEMVKFRTMNKGVDATGLPLPDAERTTRLGAFLRRSRLDELPGLWNILRGDMSVIGPRPLLPSTISAFGSLGQLRSAVKPGLTGLAQIAGNTLLDNEQKLAMDLLYVRERSASLDLLILLRTPLVMIRGEHIDPILMEKADARSCGGSC